MKNERMNKLFDDSIKFIKSKTLRYEVSSTLDESNGNCVIVFRSASQNDLIKLKNDISMAGSGSLLLLGSLLWNYNVNKPDFYLRITAIKGIFGKIFYGF